MSKYMSNRALAIVHKFFPDVKNVEDSRKPVALTVTEKDATKKGRKKHDQCALAQACKRQLNLDGAIVSMSRVYLVKGDTATRYTILPSVAREITAFDRGAGFAPSAYQLGKIGPNHAMNVKRKSTYGPKKKKRPHARHSTEGVRAAL